MTHLYSARRKRIGAVRRVGLIQGLMSAFLRVPLLIIFTSSKTFAQITARPLDATALVGQRVQLNCRTQEILDWYFVPGVPLDNSEYNRRCNKFKLDRCLMITSRGQLTDEGKQRYNESRQYSISGSPNSTLSFETVDLSYAGAYRCEGGFLDNSKLNAFVTVIGKDPDIDTRSNESRVVDIFEARTKFSTTLHCSVAIIEYTIESVAEIRINDEEKGQEESLKPSFNFFMYHPVFVGASFCAVFLSIIAVFAIIKIFYSKERGNKEIIATQLDCNYEGLGNAPSNALPNSD